MNEQPTIRERILNADDLAGEAVEVPEWRLTLLITELDAAMRAKVVETTATHQDDGARGSALVHLFPDIVIATARAPDTRALIFSRDDIEALVRKNGRLIQRLAMISLRLSKIADADAMEDAEEGFGETPSDSSTTG